MSSLNWFELVISMTDMVGDMFFRLSKMGVVGCGVIGVEGLWRFEVVERKLWC